MTVLATSRQPLDMPGEHIFPVGPLPVPEADSRRWPARPGGGDAVELFALRAAAAVPGFAVTAAQRGRRHPAVPAARRHTAGDRAGGGASCARCRSPSSSSGSTTGSRVLTGGRPGALPRHQTLRTAIEWSHELCSAAERRLWARLSVFAGTFSLAAAEEVCAEVSLERPDVVDALDRARRQVRRAARGRAVPDARHAARVRRRAARGVRASWPPAGRGTSRGTWPWRGTSASTSPTTTRWTATTSCARCTRTCARRWSTRSSDDDRRTGRGCELAGLDGLAAASGGRDGGGRGALASGAELACSLYGYWQISGLLGEGGYWLTKVLDRFPDRRAGAGAGAGQPGIPAVVPGGHRAARSPTARPAPRWRSRSATTPSRPAGTSTRCSRSPSSGGTTRRRRSATRRGPGCGRAATVAGELMLHGAARAPAPARRAARGIASRCATRAWRCSAPDSGEQWITHLPARGVRLRAVPDARAGGRLRGRAPQGAATASRSSATSSGWRTRSTCSAGCRPRPGSPARTAWLLGAADPLWERGGSVRFSGTAIMEEFHQQAARGAPTALGEAEYDACVRGGHRLRAGAAGRRRRAAARCGWRFP